MESARNVMALLGPILLVFAVLNLPHHIDAMSFVHTSGTQLQAEGRPFYHMGFDAYWMAAEAGYSYVDHVDQVLDAAVTLNMKVVRSWAFNYGLPTSPGNYDETQFKGLDYVVAGANKRGLRLVLAIGNIWPAYKGPENWLAMAEGSADGKTVADFYASKATIDLYKSQITNITSRVNTYTGVAYKDDPAIMAWDLLNEPRCPGCDAAHMSARDNFLSVMTSHLKSAAPNQLTYSSTEGYFGPGDPNVNYNPGAGGQCEGEYWTSEIGYYDVATAHVYYRQIEAMKDWGWTHPSFDFYVQYLAFKLKLYTDIAGASGRPFVLEEFGLSYRYFGEEERKVVVAVVADAVIAAKRAGRPLMGAMLWNAAFGGQTDVGGYNVYVTKQPSGAKIGLGNPAAMGAAGNTTTTSSSSSSGNSGSSGTESGSSASSPSSTARSGSSSSSNSGSSSSSAGSPSTSGTSSSSGSSSTSPSGSQQPVVAGRKMLLQPIPSLTTQAQPAAALYDGKQQRKLQEFVVDGSGDYLDGFRRGPQRSACANSAAYSWVMGSVPTTVNVEAYRNMVRGVDIVDIIAEAGSLLNS